MLNTTPWSCHKEANLHKIHFPSLLPPVVPIIPVVIPMAVDLSDAVSRELIVRMPTTEVQGL